ncbi:MAG: hypothetical protein ACRDTA_26550 [Pseudonocardiaceae bacterium]
MTGPVEAAVGVPGVPPAFPPLPGHTTTTKEELGAGGGRGELHQLFAGLASGRIVVVGAPGAGKSSAAILLLLDALAHRDSLDDTERTQVPVPVLFTGHGWNSRTTSVQDWLRDRLVATYPLFQRRGGDADAAVVVAARDKVALIFDGLDEMDEALRPAALQALREAPFRVVVLTRSPEIVQATSEARFVEAVAVRLHDVTGSEAADYLQRARTGPPPSGWTDLLTHLREHPDSQLARGLSTPLTLTLLRDTYHARDDLGDPLNPTRYSTAEHIERHLIARVLPAAYTPRPGRPPPRYSEAQARQALTFFARQMNQDHTRDLAWWHIPRWASTMPRVFTTGLAYGLADGLVYGLVYGLGLVFALGTPEPALALTIGLIGGALFGIIGGLTGKLASGKFARFAKLAGTVEPRRIRIANWRAGVSRQVLGLGLINGLAGGLVVALLRGLPGGLLFGLAGGLAGGLASVFVYGVLTEGGTGEGRPVGPREIWRNDRAAGLLIGLVFGLVLGLSKGPIWIAVGLVFGLILALFSPRTCVTILAWRQLKLSRHVPAVSLMPFLEDARERGVLRTVGGVYQLRHATLQDQLAAARPPPTPWSRRCRRPAPVLTGISADLPPELSGDR